MRKAIMNNIPISAQQLYELTQEEHKLYPMMLFKSETIDDYDTSQHSKKYALPFWPQSLFEKIHKIIGTTNNDGHKLSFIFQINLAELSTPELPQAGIIQFYMANTDQRVIDNNEREKLAFQNIFGEDNTGLYQIIYIAPEYLQEPCVPKSVIINIINPYHEREVSHKLNLVLGYFELPFVRNSMTQALYKLGHNVDNINKSLQEFIDSSDSKTINDQIDLIFNEQQNLLIHVLSTLSHPKLKNELGNKIGGYPAYTTEDNRDKKKTFFNHLLFQIDNLSNYKSMKTTGDAPQSLPYIIGVNVNSEELKSWNKAPTLNMKQSMTTMLHKQRKFK